MEINLIIGIFVIIALYLFLLYYSKNLLTEKPIAPIKQIIGPSTINHDYIPCDICNKPAVRRFTRNLQWRTGFVKPWRYFSPRHYCSKKCKRRYFSRLLYLVIMLAIIRFSVDLAFSDNITETGRVLGYIGLILSFIFLIILAASTKIFTPDPRRYINKKYENEVGFDRSAMTLHLNQLFDHQMTHFLYAI